MAQLLKVSKDLAHERKQLERRNQQWSELHKHDVAKAKKHTTMIKDLLQENLKLTNSNVNLEIQCKNLLAKN
jgi:hypothetical protein